MGPDGAWRVAPGYDLTYAPRPWGERWTTVAGVGRDVGGQHHRELARRVGIKAGAADRVIDEVASATERVREHLEAFGCAGPVSEAAATDIERVTARLRG